MIDNLLKKNRRVTLPLILVSGLILVPSFLLLMTSSWNNDDYFVSKLYQVEGLHGLSNRILTWSPRFFSEIILYLYYNFVPLLRKPFTGMMILIIWFFLLSSIFIFTRDTINKNSLFLQNTEKNLPESKIDKIYLKVLLPLLLTLTFFIYLLYSQGPSAMFYLVVVSVAYVSTLAGIIFNLNFFINKSNSKNITIKNLLLFIIFGIITSSSWEMGAIYQIFLSIFIFLFLLLNSLSNKFNYLPFSGLDKFNRWKLSIANLIPFSISLYVLYLLQSNRVGAVEGNNFESPITGNFKASLITSVLEFFREIFFLNKPAWETQTDFYSFTYSVIYKLGFLLLLTILFYWAKLKLNLVTRNACFFSIIPLLITNFIITFSSYYQLGVTSASRQTSFKSGLIGLTFMLIALILASLLSSKQPKINNKINIYSILNSPITLLINFCLTLTLLVNLQFKYLKQDLQNFQKIIISNNQNWQENLNSDQSFAIYTQVPGYYIYRMYLEPGLYPCLDKPDNETARRYYNYFNKQQLYASPLSDEKINDQFARIYKEMKSPENTIICDKTK